MAERCLKGPLVYGWRKNFYLSVPSATVFNDMRVHMLLLKSDGGPFSKLQQVVELYSTLVQSAEDAAEEQP